jgi:hypothetical protein
VDSNWEKDRLVILPLMFLNLVCSRRFFYSLRGDYLEAIQGVMKLLMKRTSKSGLLFIGELQSGARDFKPKMVNYFQRKI